MLYCGRPAAACSSCRKRRIKCDKKKPACTQCTRRSLDCPGYRDPFDQNFRDESEKVVTRVKKFHQKTNHSPFQSTAVSPRTRDTDTDACADSPLRHGGPTSSPYMPFSFSLLIENGAVAHFMSSYVPGSRFDYLLHMYAQPRVGTVLPATVQAASMASLAHELGGAEVMALARRLYAKALLLTNATLADPATATDDATLISVLLLSLFEAIVWASPRTPSNWTTHVRGAFALLKLRGSQQFQTPAGRGLFVQVANIVAVNSLRQKLRVPPDLVDLVNAFVKYSCGCPRYNILYLTAEVSSLLEDIDKGAIKADEILETALHLDAQYVSFIKTFTPAWEFQEITLEELRPDVYGNTIHIYPSHRVAQVWNTCRMTRIMLNGIIDDTAFYSTFLPRTDVRTKAIENIHEMAADICASIPPLINPSEWPPSLNPRVLCSPTCEAIPYAESISPKAITASLLWPLSTIRGLSRSIEPMRAYAMELMKELGRDFRVPQAEKVALDKNDVDTLQDGLHMFYVS